MVRDYKWYVIRSGMLVVGKRLRKRLPIDMPILDINLNETKIEQVPKYKLLGVNLDQDLTYEAHIDELCKKTIKTFGTFTSHQPLFETKPKSKPNRTRL